MLNKISFCLSTHYTPKWQLVHFLEITCKNTNFLALLQAKKPKNYQIWYPVPSSTRNSLPQALVAVGHAGTICVMRWGIIFCILFDFSYLYCYWLFQYLKDSTALQPCKHLHLIVLLRGITIVSYSYQVFPFQKQAVITYKNLDGLFSL